MFLFFLSIRQFCHTLYINNVVFVSLFSTSRCFYYKYNPIMLILCYSCISYYVLNFDFVGIYHFLSFFVNIQLEPGFGLKPEPQCGGMLTPIRLIFSYRATIHSAAASLRKESWRNHNYITAAARGRAPLGPRSSPSAA